MRVPLSHALLLIGLVAGCRPELPDPIYKGKYLHYGTTTSDPVCRGSFHRQEQHAVELARLLGVELSQTIHFTRVSRAEIPDYCAGLNVNGCAEVDAPYAFAVRSFLFHEINHVVAHLGGLGAPPPFAEGFAEVFNDGADPDIDEAPIDDVIRNFVLHDTNYFTAGRFARFLIERHDLDTFIDFMRSTSDDLSFSQFAPIFQDVFGEPIEVAIADYADYPVCTDMNNRIAVLDCNLPPAPWEGRTVTLSADVTCEANDVLGPTTDEIVLTTRAFHVDEPGGYLFFPSAPEGWSGFRVVKCGSCWDSFDQLLEPGLMNLHNLSPGRYYVLFGRNLDEPAELAVAIGKL